MILEVLKYILIVLGIIIVGAFIIYALASLMLAIVDPHAKDNKDANTQPVQPAQNQQIVYEQPKLLAEPEKEEEKIEQSDVKDVDLDKAKEEELALSQGSSVTALNEEEDNFIKEKQKAIEERINAKQAKEEEKAQDDEINLDDIFVDSDEEEKEEPAKEEPAKEEDDDEDIEALINKILAGNDDEEETEEAEEPAEEVVEEQPAEETPVATEEQPEEKTEEVVEETPVEEAVEDKNNEQEERIKALEEELARQKEEYENKLKETQDAKEQEAKEQEAKEQEINEQIEQLKQELAEKDKQLAEADKPAGALTLEEYEERLRVLNERLAVNEKEFRAVKKEYLPLAKIKKSYEKDKVKLRRKEALVAKQKVVLYGVNNYVDIDEEKAKKLSEDLDLLDGLRLSVQHCEEVLKQNEERYPILENSYNILLATNENLKSDIAECTAKIAELKADQE